MLFTEKLRKSNALFFSEKNTKIFLDELKRKWGDEFVFGVKLGASSAKGHKIYIRYSSQNFILFQKHKNFAFFQNGPSSRDNRSEFQSFRG